MDGIATAEKDDGGVEVIGIFQEVMQEIELLVFEDLVDGLILKGHDDRSALAQVGR